ADAKGQQLSTPNPRQSKGQNAKPRIALRNERDSDQGNRHHERQRLVRALLGKPSADAVKENTPGSYSSPEDCQGQGGEGCARSESLRHIERRPVTVHRFANPVEQGKRGKDPETRRQRRRNLLLWHLICPRLKRQGQAE